MSYPKESSLSVTAGGTSQKVNLSGASATSTVIGSDTAVIFATVDCFVRSGAAPVALSTGVDLFIVANSYLRLDNIKPGDKLAFITTGATGAVYITPGV